MRQKIRGSILQPLTNRTLRRVLIQIDCSGSRSIRFLSHRFTAVIYWGHLPSRCALTRWPALFALNAPEERQAVKQSLLQPDIAVHFAVRHHGCSVPVGVIRDVPQRHPAWNLEQVRELAHRDQQNSVRAMKGGTNRKRSIQFIMALTIIRNRYKKGGSNQQLRLRHE